MAITSNGVKLEKSELLILWRFAGVSIVVLGLINNEKKKILRLLLVFDDESVKKNK